MNSWFRRRRRRPPVAPGPSTSPDEIHTPSPSQRLPPPPRNSSLVNTFNTNIPRSPSPFNTQNYQADDYTSAYSSITGAPAHTPHRHYNYASPVFGRVSSPVFPSSPPIITAPTMASGNAEIPYRRGLWSTESVPRETLRVFQFSEEEGTIHQMPQETTKYEEILVQRGFTVHDEYFVDGLMERALRVCKFKTPLAMFSNYEGKSADWFITNNEVPLWFFTFLNENQEIIEYAEPNPDGVLNWHRGIDLAAWMAGTMGSKNGIAVC